MNKLFIYLFLLESRLPRLERSRRKNLIKCLLIKITKLLFLFKFGFADVTLR